MTLQTVAAMRDFLLLGPDVPDDQVIEQYGEYLASSASAPVLTLAEVKQNLRVDISDDDALISGLILAAQEYVEDHTGLVLTAREVTETAPRLAPFLVLAAWPVSAITAISYTTFAGETVQVDPAAWRVAVGRRPIRVIPLQPHWGIAPDTGGNWDQLSFRHELRPVQHIELPVTITMRAGYAAPGDVPATVKQAMHMLVAHFYNNREATEVGTRAAAIEIPFGVEVLLRKHRLDLL